MLCKIYLRVFLRLSSQLQGSWLVLLLCSSDFDIEKNEERSKCPPNFHMESQQLLKSFMSSQNTKANPHYYVSDLVLANGRVR